MADGKARRSFSRLTIEIRQRTIFAGAAPLPSLQEDKQVTTGSERAVTRHGANHRRLGRLLEYHLSRGPEGVQRGLHLTGHRDQLGRLLLPGLQRAQEFL